MKKATLKDIARLAQVSIATVSYVLNKVSTQTIPYETRCKVLEAAKELHYVPNLVARSLVMQKSGLIGILINRSTPEGYWRKLRYSALIDYLERQLTEQGYHVVLSSLDATSPKLDIISERKLDGVFLVDVKSDIFHHISTLFSTGVPLIVIDSLIEDPLFFKVVDNYQQIFSEILNTSNQTNYYLVIDNFNNVEQLASIKQYSNLCEEDIHIMTNETELQRFLLKQEGKQGIIINEYISILVAKYKKASTLTVICNAGCPEIVPAQAHYISLGDQKLETALNLMVQLLADPISGNVG
ncbi:MAG: LacI family transcriptional regulator [Candidatus Pristimantibacillus lignocellulolyticus]|uniref:LacI family transcriptional regulator n=1 Tax=Candidatus Pristimantibacillus lignocellulolyticus TaxID=2994561 RepID=A0A9J6ZG95_9BACL|nr:MAG: LacI family transcriptional regulator [Candidatus Pristimantibacillus lignocellulolyticus]